MQMTIDFATLSFIKTRARRTDPQTSKDAAKQAATAKCAAERDLIVKAVRESAAGLTAKEIADITGLDYFKSVQKRKSECFGIVETDRRRDGCAVWCVDNKPS